MSWNFLGGIGISLVAATAINLGTVIQKRTVSNGPAHGFLMGRLLKDPLWLTGLALHMIIGAPLSIIATAMLGPALTPGIMAFGLVVLAELSRRVNGERVGRREVIGIGIVIVAVFLIAASSLTIDVSTRELLDPELLMRLGLLSVACTVAAIALTIVGYKVETTDRRRPAAVLLALGSGFLVALSNLLLAPLAAAMEMLFAGRVGTVELIFLVADAAVVIVLNIIIVVVTQIALRAGAASLVVPVQQVPIQVVPILSFFLVYRPFEPRTAQIAEVCAGALLVLLGAAMVSRTQEGPGPRPARQ